jgi:hypothetical protein
LVGRQDGEIEDITIKLNEDHEIALRLRFMRKGIEPALQISARYAFVGIPLNAPMMVKASENGCPQLTGADGHANILKFENSGSRGPP